MTVGEVVSIVGICLTFISVMVAIAVFNHNVKRDRKSEADKEKQDVKERSNFYVETTLVLGELKADMKEIKEQMKDQSLKDQDLDKRMALLEQRMDNVETALKMKG